MVAQVGRYILHGLRRPGSLPTTFEGYLMGLKTMVHYWNRRRPLRLSTYRLWLWLRRRRPVALDDIRHELPAIRQA